MTINFGIWGLGSSRTGGGGVMARRRGQGGCVITCYHYAGKCKLITCFNFYVRNFLLVAAKKYVFWFMVIIMCC